jgi:hypothetical protein
MGIKATWVMLWIAGNLSLAHKCFLEIFGHRWVAMVARGITVGGHGVEGNVGYVMEWLGTFCWPMGHIKV